MFLAYNAHVMDFMIIPLEKSVHTLQTLYKSGQLSVAQFSASIAKLEAKCDKLEMSEIRYEYECQEAFETHYKNPTPQEIIADMNMQLFKLYQAEFH